MTVVISTLGFLGAPVASAAMRAVPSYEQRFRRPQVGFLRPGWGRHVEEVQGRTPAYGAALLCDMPGAPPCDRGTVVEGAGSFAGFSNFGRITNMACSEHTVILEQLDDLIGEADRIGLQSLAHVQAKTYVARFTGVSWQHPVLPGTCAKELGMARAIYTALNVDVAANGGSSGTPLPVPSSDAPADITGTIKTVAVAAAIVAGVVGVLYVGNMVRKAL